MKQNQFNLRHFRVVAAALSIVTMQLHSLMAAEPKTPGRPNILFCMADDWGWPHAGAYGDKVVKVPTFDRLAKEGVLFQHAFVSAPLMFALQKCPSDRATVLSFGERCSSGEHIGCSVCELYVPSEGIGVSDRPLAQSMGTGQLYERGIHRASLWPQR